DGRFDVTGVLRRKALRQGLISVGITCRFALQEAIATGCPCRGDREIPLADVLAAELEGDLGSAGFVAIGDVRLERTLPCFHCLIGLGGEPGRLGKRLEVCRAESALAVGLGQKVERLPPPMPLEGLTSSREAGGIVKLLDLHRPEFSHPRREDRSSTYAIN